MPEAVFDMADCLARVREGDDAAARNLVAHLYPLVLRIVRSHRPRRMDEEDLSQIVFVKMFTHLQQYSGTVPFEHWVSKIAVNACLNALRAEKARPELRYADLREDEAAVVEKIVTTSREPDAFEQLAARDLVQKLLETLSPADRLVLTMLDLEERSVEEVRQATGWNASLVKVRAFRARHKLRKQFVKLSKQRSP